MPISVGGGAGGRGVISGDNVLVNTGGTVQAGESGVVYITEIAGDEKLDLNRIALVSGDGSAVPSGVDLIIVELDGTGGAQKLKSFLEGDGSSIFDDQVGTPIATYNPSTTVNVAIVVDNGNFNTGSGSAQEVTVGLLGNIVDE